MRIHQILGKNYAVKYVMKNPEKLKDVDTSPFKIDVYGFEEGDLSDIRAKLIFQLESEKIELNKKVIDKEEYVQSWEGFDALKFWKKGGNKIATQIGLVYGSVVGVALPFILDMDMPQSLYLGSLCFGAVNLLFQYVNHSQRKKAKGMKKGILKELYDEKTFIGQSLDTILQDPLYPLEFHPIKDAKNLVESADKLMRKGVYMSVEDLNKGLAISYGTVPEIV